MTRFVDNFWDADFNSTNGYDVLLKRMKDGREMCKEYEDFLKQRAKAEDTFGKYLLKISKSFTNKDEIGTLKTAWTEVLQQTENCGQAHINISARLSDEAKKVEEFRETQKERKRKSEEAVRKLITTKKEQHSKVAHSKRTYENKCKEADGLENDLKLRFGPPKEQEKLMVKRDKAKQAMSAADIQYQKDVATLEQTRQQWEEQMMQLCVIFEQLEKERICFLRNAMWVFANIISLQCCSDDKCSDDMRNSLYECSEEKDIQLFIVQKKTGNIKPTPVVYECYYKDSLMAKAGGGISSGGRTRQTLPPIPGGMPRPDQARALPSPPMSPPPKDGIYSSMADYSTGIIGETSSGMKNGSIQYMAKYDYEAQGDKELSLRPGDILTIIDKEDETWWYAEMNGRKGHVPADYLGPYTNTGEEPHTTFL